MLVPVVLGVALALGGPGDAAPPAAARDAAARVRPGAAYAWLAAYQERFPGRTPDTRAHAASPAFVEEALRAAGASDVRRETFAAPAGRRAPLVNVHARIPGTDASHAVVLVAHHDVVVGAPGAIDDGGAVAALVEAAHALASGPPPACDVEIAIVDGEEWGCLGSKAHVDALGDAGRARVRAALAVELVGWTRDRLVVHTLPYGFAWDAAGVAPAWLPQAVVAAGDAADVAVGVGDPLLAPWAQATVRVLGLATGGDDGAYLERGVPACMLSGSSLTNFYRGYHRETDALAEVDAARLDDATRVIAAAAVTLAAVPAADASRELGDAYVLVGARHLGHGALVLLALAAAVPALLAAKRLSAGGARVAAASLAACALLTCVLAALGSVAGVVAGVPFVTLAALATALPRKPRVLVLLAAEIPALVQLVISVAALLVFGRGWRAPPVETALLLALAAAVLVATLTVRRAPPPPVE